MAGIERIAAERRRQIDEEGWTAEHDDGHADRSMARAAACYALEASGAPMRRTNNIPNLWPWHWSWWKPEGPLNESNIAYQIRNLTKAGALIAAEIDRLERADAWGAGRLRTERRR